MITRGKPIAGWFISGKIPNRKWMITRGTPMTQETSVWYNKNTVYWWYSGGTMFNRNFIYGCYGEIASGNLLD